jgi:formylglycine-generating enzyme required for sulfatase activity
MSGGTSLSPSIMEFQRFVEATGYITVAERPLKPEDYPDARPELLVPGAAVFRQPVQRVDLNDSAWFYQIARISQPTTR